MAAVSAGRPAHPTDATEHLSAERLFAEDLLHTVAIWPSSGANQPVPALISSIDFDFSTREVVDQGSLDVLCDFLTHSDVRSGSP